ncbi:MAG TPA: arginine decarboxylase, pyruvoyl-dependent [Bacillota bacterium]|nr:arginine decarboxylase, pyruvoyl-dependent [Bacillota bacterium]
MLPTPKRVKLAAGSSEGTTPLNAFDGALLAAGIGNLNLLKVSSILPPGCVLDPEFAIPPGSLTPTAFGTLTAEEPGTRIAAAIGVGFSADDYGVIMEFEGPVSRAEAEERVTLMVREGFAMRGKALTDLHVLGVEHTVKRVGSVIAAAVLWY